ncbi:hypothetical protein [Candidatus Nitrosacidococcus tergens]|uniref:Secreted protein n=1 Tax=Candidatus Nitrosacidococcus tergens TaxID=553981 RepID=A0A7G1QA08_9GAMM|nr:hypothetical protein [Candidatus Nitrosacidococcus tergens]CAB1276220.1 conserved exported protein of unknown function [Candidatus Nitrosacidococcus tergens]
MRHTIIKNLFVMGIIAFASNVFSQNPPPQSPAGTTLPAPPRVAPMYNPEQLPAYSGTIQQYLLSSKGDIDGLFMDDGTEIKTPPHHSAVLAYFVHPGDKVTIHGLKAMNLPLIEAFSITNQATGKTITDFGPKKGRFNFVETEGEVRTALHGPQGEINGILLQDGTILHFPPLESHRFSELTHQGQHLFIEGNETSNILGRVIEVNSMGISKDQLISIDTPPRPGKRPPPPPR